MKIESLLMKRASIILRFHSLAQRLFLSYLSGDLWSSPKGNISERYRGDLHERHAGQRQRSSIESRLHFRAIQMVFMIEKQVLRLKDLWVASCLSSLSLEPLTCALCFMNSVSSFDHPLASIKYFWAVKRWRLIHALLLSSRPFQRAKEEDQGSLLKDQKKNKGITVM